MALSFIRRLIFGATVRERRREFAEALDGQFPTPEQRRQLGRMVGNALVEIRCFSDNPGLVSALADAFHNLPVVMFSARFQWSWLLTFLEGLDSRYPEVGPQYLAMFDEVVGFRAELGAAVSRHTCVAPASLVPFPPSWQTDTVLSLARQIDESRDFSIMPILADALQDAGCEIQDILSHCRGLGPHVHGCWVLAWVLGEE